MRVRVLLDVWLTVDADTETEARARVARIKHEAELNIDQLVSVGTISAVEDE